MYTIEMFVNGLKNILSRCVIEETDSEITVKRNKIIETTANQSDELIVCTFPKEEINAILKKVDNQKFENFALLDNMFFERAVKASDSFILRYNNDDFSVNEHGYKLSLSKASYEYLFCVICECAGDKMNNTVFLFSQKHRLYRGYNASSYKEFLDNLFITTVKIEAPKNKSHTEFNKMLHSYLFNIAYNNNILITILDFLETYKPIRRRLQRNGQLFPYKSYKNELIKYYYQASTAGMPLTQYLAYYHVAEFFFHSVAENEAYDSIEKLITHPSFSPYNKECIREFYKKITKIMRTQKEEGVWEEKTSLLLCLKKYVPDLELLKTYINDIDSKVLEYYRNNDISFSTTDSDSLNSSKDKVRINFDDSSDAIYANIRNRVYLVRNAIVHSKNGEKLRYEPFKHDKELQKEIPLIRAIAEEIIINSAKEIDFN